MTNVPGALVTVGARVARDPNMRTGGQVMTLRQLVATAVLATSFLATPGHSLTPPADHRDGETEFAAALRRRPLAGAEPGFWGRLVGADGRPDPARAWRESATTVASAARPFAQVSASAEQPTTTVVDVGTAGDLDGDGRVDVALLRHVYRVDPVWVLDHVDVEARSGRTGKRLWAKRVTVPRAACENLRCGHLISFGYAYAPQAGTAGITVVALG